MLLFETKVKDSFIYMLWFHMFFAYSKCGVSKVLSDDINSIIVFFLQKKIIGFSQISSL